MLDPTLVDTVGVVQVGSRVRIQVEHLPCCFLQHVEVSI